MSPETFEVNLGVGVIIKNLRHAAVNQKSAAGVLIWDYQDQYRVSKHSA